MQIDSLVAIELNWKIRSRDGEFRRNKDGHMQKQR